MDDATDDHPAVDDEEEKAPASWSVALLDDCEACEDLRVVLTLEDVGEHGRGVVAHLAPETAVRLRRALATALREIGVDPG